MRSNESKIRRAEAKQLKTELCDLKDSPVNSHSQQFQSFISSKKSTLEQSLNHATLGQRICRNQKKLGLVACISSLGSLSTKVPMFITTAAHSAQAVSHSLTVASTALGSIGAFLLGPLVTIYSARLGQRRSTQITHKRRQIKAQLTLAKNLLNTQATENTSSSPEFHAYKNFIQRQGDKRSDFFRGFKQWNKAFRVATGFYGLAVGTQIVVGIVASCVGSAVAANPIGLGIILSLTTLAGLGMSVSSFVLSRRENKYFSHTAQQGQLFNRDLVVFDQMLKKGTNTQFALASSCLKRLDTRKEAIRTFLNEAAKQSNKVSPLGLVEQGKKTSETQATIWKKLQGQVLTSKDLGKYLETDQGKQQFRKFLETDVTAEIDLLDAEINLHRASLSTNNEPKISTESLTDKKLSAELVKNSLDWKKVDDTQTFEYLGISNTKNNSNHTHTLAKYLLENMDRTLRDERGILFETQLQATKTSA